MKNKEIAEKLRNIVLDLDYRVLSNGDLKDFERYEEILLELNELARVLENENSNRTN